MKDVAYSDEDDSEDLLYQSDEEKVGEKKVMVRFLALIYGSGCVAEEQDRRGTRPVHAKGVRSGHRCLFRDHREGPHRVSGGIQHLDIVRR